jgi:CheY-like chemotaxis protein
VLDTGIGIAPDARSRMFCSFSQADASTTRKFGGTGLGLAISKQLVELMGGAIGFTSAQGSGSTFYFTVPLEEQPAPAQSLARAQSIPAGLDILCVDDVETNRRILDRQLRSGGMRPVCVDGGVAALAELRRAHAEGRPFVVAILDMHMPGMDGLALASEIRNDPAIAATRLMLLTSVSRHHLMAEANAAGIAVCMTKPVRQSMLYATLEGMFESDAEVAAVVALEAPAPALPETVRPVAVPPAALSARVLLTEDNLVNQKVAVRMLATLGIRPALAVNGLQALKLCAAERFDLILMDCQMPEMDGYATTAALRERELLHGLVRTPIVAMTANAMKGDRERCLEGGMDDYICKPVRIEELRELVVRWLAPAPADTQLPS